jgi:hypothetical protein
VVISTRSFSKAESMVNYIRGWRTKCNKRISTTTELRSEMTPASATTTANNGAQTLTGYAHRKILLGRT